VAVLAVNGEVVAVVEYLSTVLPSWHVQLMEPVGKPVHVIDSHLPAGAGLLDQLMLIDCEGVQSLVAAEAEADAVADAVALCLPAASTT
jgi:hypothetical protein